MANPVHMLRRLGGLLLGQPVRPVLGGRVCQGKRVSEKGCDVRPCPAGGRPEAIGEVVDA